jgi:hypothetical protein
MSPIIGEQDEFEGNYTEKFRSLAKPYGEFVKYEHDRAAIDIGLHLTQTTDSKYKNLSNTRIWVQLKGVHSSTLKLEDFTNAEYVTLDLKIDHLRFWHASPEAVYLIVYIECADLFLAEDIRDVVDRQWGENIFQPTTFRQNQEKARVRVSTSAILDDKVWSHMLKHRALRIDGPTFRGRPLGHRLDPLRCIPNNMEPSVFSDVVNRLLSVHGFKLVESLDESLLFPNICSSGDIASLSLGVMYYTYEWIPQLFTEFGFDPDSDFRIEGDIEHVQGPCAVLIHSNKVSYPDPGSLEEFAQELVKTKGIRQLLAFVNDDDPAYYGKVLGTDVECMPQILSDLAFNLLTATTVYLEFRDKITWRIVNYLF